MAKEILLQVFYEDTDFTGYVFHANFLKYFSRAREEYLGISNLKNLYEQGKHFVVRSTQLLYHKPVSHGDVLRISSLGQQTQAAVVSFKQDAYLQKNDASTELAVSAVIDIVSVNRQGRPIRIPPEIIDWLARSG